MGYLLRIVEVGGRSYSMAKFGLFTAILLLLTAALAASGPAYAQNNDVSGLWSGTTRVTPPCAFSSGRCNAVNNITFNFRQKGDRIKGKFTCAYGNLICRNGGADSSGKIVSGRIAGDQIRLSVVVPADVSNCYYNGIFTSATAIRGAYSCYQGGELLEEGMWEAKKNAAP
jgi:hypothetical protein